MLDIKQVERSTEDDVGRYQSTQNVGILESRIPRKVLESEEGSSLKGEWAVSRENKAASRENEAVSRAIEAASMANEAASWEKESASGANNAGLVYIR